MHTMETATKHAKGKLLDTLSREILGEGQVTIVRQWSEADGYEPSPTGTMLLDGYKPHLSDKVHILELKGSIAGQVRVSLGGIFDLKKTPLKIFFSDAVWSAPDWFDAL